MHVGVEPPAWGDFMYSHTIVLKINITKPISIYCMYMKVNFIYRLNLLLPFCLSGCLLASNTPLQGNKACFSSELGLSH